MLSCQSAREFGSSRKLKGVTLRMRKRCQKARVRVTERSVGGAGVGGGCGQRSADFDSVSARGVESALRETLIREEARGSM